MATLLIAQGTRLHQLRAIVILKLRTLDKSGLTCATNEMPCSIFLTLLLVPRILSEVTLVDVMLVF